jgi:hypothetical protein
VKLQKAIATLRDNVALARHMVQNTRG